MRVPTLAFEHSDMRSGIAIRVSYRVLGCDDVIVRWYDDAGEVERFVEDIDAKPDRYVLRVDRYRKGE